MSSLIALHHNEVAKGFGVLDIDLELYFTLTSFDMFKVVVARTDDEELIGYMTFIIGANPHRKGKLIANQDAIFVHPDHRKSMLGIKLMKVSEKIVKERGCVGMIVASKTRNDISKLYERLGFNSYEYTFYKEIGGE
jgi:GNAT superfamily N-acetyltransferase